MKFYELVVMLTPYVPLLLVGGMTMIIGLLGGYIIAARGYRKLLLSGVKYGRDIFRVTHSMVGALQDGFDVNLGVLSNDDIDKTSVTVFVNGLRQDDPNVTVTSTGNVLWRKDNVCTLGASDTIVVEYRYGKLIPVADVYDRTREAQPEAKPDFAEIAHSLCLADPGDIFFRGRAFFTLTPMSRLEPDSIFVLIDKDAGWDGEIMRASSLPSLNDDGILAVEASPLKIAKPVACMFCGKEGQWRHSALADKMPAPLCDRCNESHAYASDGGKKAITVSPKPKGLPTVEPRSSSIPSLESLGLNADDVVKVSNELERNNPVHHQPVVRADAVVPGILPRQMPRGWPKAVADKLSEQRRASKKKAEIAELKSKKTPPKEGVLYRFWGVTNQGLIVADATSETDVKKWAKSRDVFVDLGLYGERPIPEDVLKRFKLAPGTLGNEACKAGDELGSHTGKLAKSHDEFLRDLDEVLAKIEQEDEKQDGEL